MVKFPKQIFLTTLVIALLVFAAGLLLGYNLDNLRTEEILVDLKGNELDTESYLVEQAFTDTFGGDECSFAQPRLTSISQQLAELGHYLNSYEQKSIFEANEFEYLARRYFLLEIKAYTLEIQLRDKCDLDNPVILFFYGAEDQGSETQGFVLDKLVSSDDSVSVYSINAEFEGDEALETLKLYYEVTKTPTLVINGNLTKEGYVGYNELVEILEE